MSKNNKYKYEIQGKILILNEFTNEQAILLSQFGDLVEIDKAQNYTDLIQIIVSKHLSKFMNEIIFYNQNTENIDWLKASFNTTVQIIEDFLALNPQLKRGLRSLFEKYIRPAMQKAVETTQNTG